MRTSTCFCLEMRNLAITWKTFLLIAISVQYQIVLAILRTKVLPPHSL